MLSSNKISYSMIMMFFVVLIVISFQAHTTTDTVWQTKLIIKSIQRALDTFYLDVGRYPSNEEGLKILYQRHGKMVSWNGPYVDDCFSMQDAWGQQLIYVAATEVEEFLKDWEKVDKEIDYVLYSIGQNKRDERGIGDDIITFHSNKR